MADNNTSGEALNPRDSHHHVDQLGTKLVDQVEKYQKKMDHTTGGKAEKKPAGGFDATPIPKAPPGYTLRITFHRAKNLPFADIPTLSSDPYILAVLRTDLQKRHKQDDDLHLRTPTIHRNTNPEWNTVWTIAHVPSSGFYMKCRLYDEDPADHDDRLGNVHVNVGRIDDSWQGFKEKKFEVKKRMGSKRAYTIRGCAALLTRSVKLGGEVHISVENLGRSEGNGGRAYTISPLPWSQHYSPLIGLIAGTKDKKTGKNGKKDTERYNFQAIQMQLQGPVPEHLYHRYVEFKPFVAGMFTSHTLRGRILNHALHHQHARIYNFDGSTKYGEFEKPGIEVSKKFLDFVHHDQGGRVFTYVITLDGQFRFTETGKEFGIDLLSKHTMHSDVSIYIAFSGEFFVRRLKHPHENKKESPNPETDVMPPATEKLDEKEKEKEDEREAQKEKEAEHSTNGGEHHNSLAPPVDYHESARDSSKQPASDPKRRSFSPFMRRSRSATSSVQSPAPHADQTREGDDPSQDPSHYELIIDNDSGTYRPNAEYLGQLKKFLQHNFPGLRIATLDSQGDAERMQKLKGEQRDRKKKSGTQITYMQNMSMSSISSSDEEELERRAAEEEDAEEEGTVKSQWNKVKSLAKGEKKEDEKLKLKEKNESSPVREDGPSRLSESSDEKHSFDTATEHGAGHFVTPKPSLGFGGLNQFETEDRPLSRGIDDELERRGMKDLEQEKAEQVPDTIPNGHLTNYPFPGGVHQSVTSTA